MLPDQLTRRRGNGVLYTRRPEIDAALESLLAQPREAILAALEIRDRQSASYIPSECVVHLIRRTRLDNDRTYFGHLYRELMRRIEAALPRFSGERVGAVQNVHAADARDQVRDEFNRKLMEDQQEPGDGLDYFEVMFNHAVSSLRSTAVTKARRENARHSTIEFDGEENEPSAEVETAFANFNPAEELLSDDPIYRRRVAAAIDSLPDKQRQVIALMLKGFPMDSTDPNVDSIRLILGIVEKTVRNRRDAAFEAIRSALRIGNGDD